MGGCHLWCFGGVCNAIQWPNLSLYRILRCIVVYLFLMRWHVVVNDGRFVASDHFFFLPAFLSLPEMVHVFPLIFRFINFNPYIFIVYFSPWFYYKSFKCFQFSPWIIIFHILFFPIQSVFIYVAIILYWF